LTARTFITLLVRFDGAVRICDPAQDFSSATIWL
jgi:hypothetical protein